MGSTVQHGAWEIQSSDESAAEMVEALKQNDKPDKPREIRPIRDRGKDVEPEKPKVTVQEAGKRGGEAAARAREEKAEAKPKGGDATEPAGAETVGAATRPAAKDDDAQAAGSASPEAKPAEDKDEHGGRAQARIQQLAREKREAQDLAREVTAAKRELEERIARLERGERPQPVRREAPTAPDDDPEPNMDDYPEWTDFNKAQAAHAARAEIRRQQQAVAAQQWQESHHKYVAEQNQQFQERFEAGKTARPELEERIDPELLTMLNTTPPGVNPTVSSMIADEIWQSEHPYELLAHFSEHPDDMRRLVAARNPRLIARGIGILDDRFGGRATTETPAAEPERRHSAAPPPIQAISASPVPSEPDITKEMDFDTFHRLKNPKKR